MEPWLQDFIPKPKTGRSSQSYLMVSQLINQELHVWKTNLVLELFEPKSAHEILSIQLPIRSKPDRLIWVPNPKGKFSVKSAYYVTTARSPNSLDVPWNKLWNLRAPERTKMLLWRIDTNALPTKENLI